MRLIFIGAILFAATATAHAEVNPECLKGPAAKAIPACSLVLQQKTLSDADQVQARITRAQWFIDMNMFDESSEDLKKILMISPRNPTAFAIRGRLSLARNEKDKAQEDLNRALALSPNYVYALWLRGALYTSLNRFDEAKKDLDLALANDPNHTSSLVERSRVFKRLSKIDEALQDLDRAIALSPRYAFALKERGDARQLKGDLAGALADYNAAIEIVPGDTFAMSRRDAVNRLLQSKTGTKPAATTAPTVATTPNVPGTTPPSATASGSGNAAAGGAAAAVAPKAVAPEQPGEAQVLLDAARKAMTAKDYETVFKQMSRYISFNKTTAEAYMLRGQALYRGGNQLSNADMWKQAIPDLDQAIALSPQLYSAMFTRGYAHHAVREYAKAKEDGDRLVQANAGDWRGFALRCYVLGYQSKYDEAIPDCDTAVKLEPRQSDRLADRALVNYWRANYTAAEGDLDKATQLDPRNTRALSMRGSVLLANGRSDAAAAAYGRVLDVDAGNDGAKRGLQVLLIDKALTQFSALASEAAPRPAAQPADLVAKSPVPTPTVDGGKDNKDGAKASTVDQNADRPE